MKQVDIVPGTLAAISPSYWDAWWWGGYRRNSEAVMAGTGAQPVRIISMGKWRAQKQGGCEVEFIEDGFTTTVLVERIDMEATAKALKLGKPRYDTDIQQVNLPGFPEGEKLSSKKIVWVKTVVDPRQLKCPWDHFLKLREEALFAKQEIEAHSKRQGEALSELSTLLAPYAAAMAPISESKGNWRVEEIRDGKIKFRFIVPLNIPEWIELSSSSAHRVPAHIRKKVEALYAEHADLTRRLACKR